MHKTTGRAPTVPAGGVRRVMHYAILALIALVGVGPLLWMFLGSIGLAVPVGGPELDEGGLLHWLANYRYVLTETNVPRQLVNSLGVGLVTGTVTTVLCACLAYALSRLAFPGRSAFLGWVTFLQIFPWTVALVPVYLMIARVHLIDNLLSLVILYSVATVPFGTWVLKAAFDALPRELEEAGLVDGATFRQTILRLVVPLAAPSVVVVWIWGVIYAMQEFVLALVLLKTEELYTISVGLTRFLGTYGEVRWGALMAAGFLTALPLTLVFFYVQRYVVEGLTAGSGR